MDVKFGSAYCLHCHCEHYSNMAHVSISLLRCLGELHQQLESRLGASYALSPPSAYSAFSKSKFGQFLQACFLILIRDLSPDVIPASLTSSNCVHCKISIFNKYLQSAYLICWCQSCQNRYMRCCWHVALSERLKGATLLLGGVLYVYLKICTTIFSCNEVSPPARTLTVWSSKTASN